MYSFSKRYCVLVFRAYNYSGMNWIKPVQMNEMFAIEGEQYSVFPAGKIQNCIVWDALIRISGLKRC